MNKIEAGEEYTKKVLDSIDIKRIVGQFSEIKDITDIMIHLEHMFENTDIVNNEYMEGFLFNWMNQDDFLYYLQKRYGDDFYYREKTITYIYFKS